MADAGNIVLIGMPGAGKSTCGVLIAKALSRSFVDTDLVIQAVCGRRLPDIIESEGLESFLRREEEALLCLHDSGMVIATGGSAVYCERGMRHLKKQAVAVHLWLPLEELAPRVGDINERGVVRGPNQTLEELYRERMPLYEKWADVSVDCSGKGHPEVVRVVCEAVAALQR